MNANDNDFQPVLTRNSLWVPDNPVTRENLTRLTGTSAEFLYNGLRPPHPRVQEVQNYIQRLVHIWTGYILADAVPSNDVVTAGRALQKIFYNTCIDYILREGVYSDRTAAMLQTVLCGLELQQHPVAQEADLATLLSQLQLQQD